MSNLNEILNEEHIKTEEELLDDRIEEWNEIEDHVMIYKKQFEDGATEKDKIDSKKSAEILLQKFHPLIKKYIMLFKTGRIDFTDSDIKTFVGTFISDPRLHGALKRQKSKAEYKSDIYKAFGFVLETYAQLSEEEILIDLQVLLLTLAKRYTQMGKNFCAYVRNSFRYEVSRHIKNHIKNPINISYKTVPYEDTNNGLGDDDITLVHEDLYYEPQNGIPDMNWVNGNTCSDTFSILTSLERKIVIKYYAEEFNDKQISDALGLHINTVNQKRRQAVNKIAEKLGIDMDDVKRNRNSGRQNSDF